MVVNCTPFGDVVSLPRDSPAATMASSMPRKMKWWNGSMAYQYSRPNRPLGRSQAVGWRRPRRNQPPPNSRSMSPRTCHAQSRE